MRTIGKKYRNLVIKLTKEAMEKRIIKIRIESDCEEDLKDAVVMARDILLYQPWRSDLTKTGKAWSTKG